MSDEQRDGAMSDGATDETLRALAEPRRRAILRLVARDELAAGEIAAAFEVTRTAISQHLTVLKNAGLLAERRDGTRRLYRARPGRRAYACSSAWAGTGPPVPGAGPPGGSAGRFPGRPCPPCGVPPRCASRSGAPARMT